MAAIYSLYIINKSGGLIFYKVNRKLFSVCFPRKWEVRFTENCLNGFYMICLVAEKVWEIQTNQIEFGG
jgi:hypothetical protein